MRAWLADHAMEIAIGATFAVIGALSCIREIGALMGARNTGFTASDAEADKVYQEYLAKQEIKKEYRTFVGKEGA